MFGIRKKEQGAASFDRAGKEPVIRCSICTGEQVAGFRDTATGKLEECALIRSDADLQAFLSRYGLQASEVRKIW